MPSEGDRAMATGNKHKKLGEDRSCGFRVTWADRQTDWHTHNNTSHLSHVRSNSRTSRGLHSLRVLSAWAWMKRMLAECRERGAIGNYLLIVFRCTAVIVTFVELIAVTDFWLAVICTTWVGLYSTTLPRYTQLNIGPIPTDYSTVALVPPTSTMDVWRGIT